MANTDTNTVPFHLAGAFAPVAEERTDFDLDVVGELPPDLRGTYVRNGPNPRAGRSPAWFVGEGMLHGVRISDGRAAWHRNRWITGAYAPNTNVIRHAGRILALVETRPPVEVTPELETVGPYDFGGALEGSMTAHPRLCPQSGELLFFSCGPTRPHLTYYRADAAGRVTHRAPIDIPAMTLMHDFAISERYVIFYVLPVLVGDFRSPVPLRWDDDFPARFGVLPRDGVSAQMRWFDVEPCMIIHTINAFEDGDSIMFDALRAPRPMAPAALHRFQFDLRTGRTTERMLNARYLDFPRVSPTVVGARHRYAYTTEIADFVPGRGSFTRTLARKIDLETGASVVHDFGGDAMPGECTVVPRAAGAAEDDAWAILFVHPRDGSPSELVVLDAAELAGPPVARVRMRSRVPFGLHGDWLPDA